MISVLSCLKKLGKPIFTTKDISILSGKSLSSVTQGLNFLEKEKAVFKVYHGVWAETGNRTLSPHAVIPYLFPKGQAYLSFISALHLYGVIEQIPQIITVAALTHSKVVKTRVGSFDAHRIGPRFFKGFDWYKGTGSFLIASPEKALVDCLYISTRRGKKFTYFPELELKGNINIKKVEKWARSIPSPAIKKSVLQKLHKLAKSSR